MNEPISAEIRAWEAWAASVKVGDRCRVAGMPATVTAVQGEFLWARQDGCADALPWDWEDVGPFDRGVS